MHVKLARGLIHVKNLYNQIIYNQIIKAGGRRKTETSAKNLQDVYQNKQTAGKHILKV